MSRTPPRVGVKVFRGASLVLEQRDHRGNGGLTLSQALPRGRRVRVLVPGGARRDVGAAAGGRRALS